jgi:type IV secretory pathway TrbD component
VALYLTALIVQPRLRKVLAIFITLLLLGGILGWQTILDGLHRWSGELQKPHRQQPTVVIDGERVVYSGTLTRVYLFDVYGVAMRRAGWLGFGTERTSTFPVNVPVGQQHTETLKRLPWIDNQYILLVLRFGYLGVAVFITFCLSGVFAMLMVCRRCGGRGMVFFGGLAATIVAMMLLLLTVWMPHDFGFWFLWTLGVSSGLAGRKMPDFEPTTTTVLPIPDDSSTVRATVLPIAGPFHSPSH